MIDLEKGKEKPKTKETPRKIVTSNVVKGFHKLTEGDELYQDITILESLFKKMNWKMKRKEIKEDVKNGEYDQLIICEKKCPGLLERLSKEYTGRDWYKKLPKMLNSSIKYATKDDAGAYNLKPLHNLLEKDKPSKEDIDKTIQALNKIQEENTFTMEETIVKDRAFLLKISNSTQSMEDYKDHMRKTYHMGSNDCDSTVQYLLDNTGKVLEEAQKQGKSNSSIESVRQLIEQWKQQK